MTNTKLIRYNGKWSEVRAGIYYNGKGFTGTEKQSMEICILKGRSEVGIIGDYYPNMGSATVIIDGKIVGQIGKSISTEVDTARLKLSSKSHIMKITVDKGSITLTGYLADEQIITDAHFNSDVDDKNDYGQCRFGVNEAKAEAVKKQQKTMTNVGVSAGSVVVVAFVGVASVIGSAILCSFIYIKYFINKSPKGLMMIGNFNEAETRNENIDLNL